MIFRMFASFHLVLGVCVGLEYRDFWWTMILNGLLWIDDDLNIDMLCISRRGL